MAKWKILNKEGEQSFETEERLLGYIKRELSAALDTSPIANSVVIDPDGVRCDIHINIRLEEQLPRK